MSPDHFQGVLGPYFVNLKRQNEQEIQYQTIPDDNEGKFIEMFKDYI